MAPSSPLPRHRLEGEALTEVAVLRLGHRRAHDRRLSTHVCLTARAFGADRVLFPEVGSSIRATIEDVEERFGGSFEVAEEASWRSLLNNHDGPIVHLTMYGTPHTEVVDRLSSDEDLIVVVGAAKVPADVYDLATYNVAVGNQPHSEVAALGVFLYDLLGPEELYAPRPGAEVVIEPSPEGKHLDHPDQGT